MHTRVAVLIVPKNNFNNVTACLSFIFNNSRVF